MFMTFHVLIGALASLYYLKRRQVWSPGFSRFEQAHRREAPLDLDVPVEAVVRQTALGPAIQLRCLGQLPSFFRRWFIAPEPILLPIEASVCASSAF